MNSLWSETAQVKSFDTLKGNIKTDVLIIGGGLAGILCAYMLHSEGVDYILVEQNRILSGVTKNTTAKITSQHGLIYHKILKKYGKETAKKYYDINEKAIKEYAKLCENTNCDFEYKSSFVYSIENEFKIQKELSALSEIGADSAFKRDLPLPFEVCGAVEFKNQAQFHPIKFVSSVCENLNIYENTKVNEIIGNVALTSNGNIIADKIIVATHFPFINKHGSYFIKMYQERSYVIALNNGADVEGMYVDEAQKGMSFRNHGKYLLVGGGDHRTGKNGGNYKELIDFARRYYKEDEISYKWATQDAVTLDSMPYIGQYSKNTPGLFVATGFNKWGMSSSMVSAMILKDVVTEKENEYADIFSPSRSVVHPQLFINAGESVFNLITPTKPRCPHLGCALKYNKEEHSWDCPCHGSRFKTDGQLINNPATDNLKLE